VLPGGVDPHAHVYEGLASAPLAAVRSGTTEVEAYAPPAPGERVEDACARWDALAAGAACRVHPLATVYEPAALDEASFAALAAQGVRGIKLFLAYRELGIDADDELLVRAFFWSRAHGVVLRLHCENAGAIHVLRERLRQTGDTGVAAHPRSRPPLVEEEGIRRAIDLARLADAPVYIVHVSTAGSTSRARPARSSCCSMTASMPARWRRWA
jgi:dihydropyrimidinase